MKTCSNYKNPALHNEEFWENHLPGCEECRLGFEEATLFDGMPKVMKPSPAEENYFNGLPDRVLNQINQPKILHLKTSTFKILSVAASFIIIAGFMWMYLPSLSVTETDYTGLEVSGLLQNEALVAGTDDLFDIYSTDSKEIESALTGLTETYQYPVSEEQEPVLDETELESLYQEAESQRKGS